LKNPPRRIPSSQNFKGKKETNEPSRGRPETPARGGRLRPRGAGLGVKRGSPPLRHLFGMGEGKEKDAESKSIGRALTRNT